MTQNSGTVFFSYCFEECDHVGGLGDLFARFGLRVLRADAGSESISESVLARIREADCVLCLLTRNGSAWVHQELGAAVGIGKPIVLLVEEGVSDVGGLQGDLRTIVFKARGFLRAALRAIDEVRRLLSEDYGAA